MDEEKNSTIPKFNDSTFEYDYVVGHIYAWDKLPAEKRRWIYLRLLKGWTTYLGTAISAFPFNTLQKPLDIPAPLLNGLLLNYGFFLFYDWVGKIWNKPVMPLPFKLNKWLAKLLRALSLLFYGKEPAVLNPLEEIETWSIVRPFDEYSEKTWLNIVNDRLKAPNALPIYFKGNYFVAFKFDTGETKHVPDYEAYFTPIQIQVFMCSDKFEIDKHSYLITRNNIVLKEIREAVNNFFHDKTAFLNGIIEDGFLKRKSLTDEERDLLREMITQRVKEKGLLENATIGEIKQTVRSIVRDYFRQKRRKRQAPKVGRCLLCGEDLSKVSRKGKYCGTCSKEKTYIKNLSIMLKDPEFFEKFLNRSLSKEELANIKKKIGRYDPYKLLTKRIKLNLKRGWVEKDVKSWFSEETLKKLITAFNIT